MVQKIKIVVNTNSISINPGSISNGEIYIQYNNCFFPEENWNDFIDVILNWWIEELIQILQKTKTKAMFAFMDGSFEIIIENLGNDVLELCLIENESSVGNDERIQVSLKQLTTEIKFTTNEVIRYCNNNNITSAGFEKLKSNLKKLQLMNSSFNSQVL